MKKLTLIPEWRRVLNKAWSLRLTVLGAAFGGLEMALPVFSDAVPHGVFLLLSMLAAIGGAVARLVAQPKMSGDA